jgi:2-polyprenyl-3-methyl-5-hydroxy-6-metoxy-1,4-benzoquinol methylase
MPISSTIRRCPVCGSAGERRIVDRQEFQEGVLGHGYYVVVCGMCGAGYADGIPEQEVLDRHYSNQSKYAYEGTRGTESEYDFRRFEIIFDRLAPFLPAHGARILDIGCATGGLLSVFKRHGFNDVLGIDPSAACASAARRLYGIDVRVSTLGQLADWTQRFDLILMVGVLEHVREALSAVHDVGSLAASDGLVYVSVPDVLGFAACRNAPYQQFSMEHVNFFSSLSLNRVMAACGFAPKHEWRETVEWREGVDEPLASGLYQRAQTALPGFDDTSGTALDRYVEASRRGHVRMLSRIEALVSGREPMIVWGAGALTRRLLATTPLGKANIVGFVDSNPHLQGTQLAGRKVLAPKEISGLLEPILICSVAFEHEIIELIRRRLLLTNRLLSLAD